MSGIGPCQGEFISVRYDRIANSYDLTRRPPDEEILRGITAAFAEHGCRSILEVGVGTGRVSVHLVKSGLQVAGVDVSRPMLERARAKLLADLAVGDGTSLPFKEKSFDAVLMVHVVHLVDDLWALMREASRVSRTGIFVLVDRRVGYRPPDQASGDGRAPASGPWDGPGSRGALPGPVSRSLRRIRRSFAGKDTILSGFTPDETRVVHEALVEESFGRKILRAGWRSGSRAQTMLLVGLEAISELGRRSGLAPAHPQREAQQLAFWRSERFRAQERR